MSSQREDEPISPAGAPAGPRPFQVMTKPNGPRCNLDCTYCYYLEKERLYPDVRKFRMGDDVLETFIRDYIASQSRLDAQDIWFSWQGGEPTLLGVDYYRKVVDLQRKYCPQGRTVRNALQTNGTLLDPEWAAFLKENGFLVGLSIDGPRDQHDRYRIDRREMSTFDRVMAALKLLRDGGVDFNVLTVVHRQNARKPREVYRFLKSIGVEFMQFIPAVERLADGKRWFGHLRGTNANTAALVTSWSVLPDAYGDFLCGVFDEWIKKDVGRIFVQFFDLQLGLWMGAPAELCWFAEACGQQMALEHNGDLYACDHYVYPEYLLGNITRTPLGALAASPEQVRFGEDKQRTLPRCCIECEFRFACNGGCPKHRFLKTPEDEVNLNYFCAAHRQFFAHAGPHLRTMANLLHQGNPASRIMDLCHPSHSRPDSVRKLSGRNEPCPCGSGRKFKKCCGRTTNQ